MKMTKKLGFGCMRLPLLNENDQQSVDTEQLDKMVDLFLKEGFTYFDTAYMYHDFTSENFVRKSLVERHPRESFIFADKMPIMHLEKQEDVERIFNEQLKKCGVEYFDNYLIHNVCTAFIGPCTEYGCYEFVKKMKAEGKIRRMGFSFHDTPEMLEDYLKNHPDFDFIQLQINYLDWDNGSIQSRRCYDIARKYNLPVYVMEPVRGGALADVPARASEMFRKADPGMSDASWAIRFAASLEGVEMVLSGMSEMYQLEDNISFMKDFKPLTDKETEMVFEAGDIVTGAMAIPCTSCQYCVKGCPQELPIHRFFSLYNTEKRTESKLFSVQLLYYDSLITKYKKASRCIECGKCEEVCPQHINIIDMLKEVSKTFEIPH